ncbi:MAG: hypothetical protein NC904_00275, partial [Candidatus Omnitrophica bacterium]|nr:hypothetical protein [Candidatus Omnitrophota bacterium]
MTYFSISTVLTFFISLSLGIFVLFKNYRGTINRLFFFLSLSVSIWSMGLRNMAISKTHDLALLWIKISYLGVFFIPSIFLHFMCALLDIQESKRQIINLGYILSFLFLILNLFTKLIIVDVSPKFFFNYYGDIGELYLLFIGMFLFFSIYGIYLCFKNFKNISAFKKNQVKYVIIASIVGFGGSFDTFLPKFNIPMLYQGIQFVPLYLLIVSYAIIKYRLMDIKLARQYLTMNIFYGIVASVIFIALAFFLRQWFWGIAVVIFLAVLLSPYLHQKMTKFLEPAFLGETFRIWDRLRYFWGKPRIVFTSAQLADNLKEMPEVMGLDSFSFFLFNQDRDVFIP